MSIPGPAYLSSLLSAAESPAISVYQPTHRSHPDNAGDPIRFKNLVKQVEESIDRHYPVREKRSLLDPFHKLQADAKFWEHTLDGLAVFASPTRFDVFQVGKVGRAVPELAVVAESFNIKPLLRYLQSADRFELLAVSRDNVAVYEGNRYALDQIDARHVPTKFLEGPATPRTQSYPDADTERFYRAVDHAVTEHVSVPSGVPLVLAAASENLAAFRAVTKNPHLIPDDIAIDPFALDAEALRKRAWAVLEPHYLARLKELGEAFGLARSRDQATGDLTDAANAAIGGRVATLLLDADKSRPGRLDPATGAFTAVGLGDPTVDDAFDDLAELVLKTGGRVVVVPSDKMPTATGVAAIYRY